MPALTTHDEARRRIAALLSEIVPFDVDEIEDVGDRPERGVMTKFVCITEWQDESGEYWRSVSSGDGFGDRDLPSWAVTGLAYSVAQDMT